MKALTGKLLVFVIAASILASALPAAALAQEPAPVKEETQISSNTQPDSTGQLEVEILDETPGETSLPQQITVLDDEQSADEVLAGAEDDGVLAPANTGWIEVRKGIDLVAMQQIEDPIPNKFRLMNDVSMEGIDWSAPGTKDHPFAGELDGNGFTISGLEGGALVGQGKNAKIYDVTLLGPVTTKNTVSLVETLTGGSVTNCHIIGTEEFPASVNNLNLKGCNLDYGALVGSVHDGGVVSNCTVSGNVTVTNNVENTGGEFNVYRTTMGGIVGWLESGTVTNCTVEGNANGSVTLESLGNSTGGIVGRVDNQNISNCSVKGSVSISNTSEEHNDSHSKKCVGGIVGWMGNGNISECELSSGTGKIELSTKTFFVGGIAGNVDKGNISACTVTGNIALSNYFDSPISHSKTGGIVGNFEEGTISECKLEAKNGDSISIESSSECLGGIAGRISKGSVNKCSVTADDNSKLKLSAIKSNIGGLVGEFCISVDNYDSQAPQGAKDCTVENVSIVGESSIGGLIGFSENIYIDNCHTNVTITDHQKSHYGSSTGGLVGDIRYYEGYEKSQGITNCSTKGSISVIGDKVGGFIGYIDSSEAKVVSKNNIAACSVDTFGGNIGGFVGLADNCAFIDSKSEGEYLLRKDVFTNFYAGGFAGSLGETDISGCTSSMPVTGAGGIAGFAGHLYNCNLTNASYTGGKVLYWESYEGSNSETNFAGFSTRIENSTLQNCSTNADVYANKGTGAGFANALYGEGTLSECHATGSKVMSPSAEIASGFVGLIGADSKLLIENCSSSASVTGKRLAGGFIGSTVLFSADSVKVENCGYTGKTVESLESFGAETGGFIGRSLYGIQFKNCYSAAESVISKGDQAGGFAGTSLGDTSGTNIWMFENCQASANVSGRNNVGGFIGFFEKDNSTVGIKNCIASGNVTAEYSNAGAFAGGRDSGNITVKIENSIALGTAKAGQWSVSGFACLKDSTYLHPPATDKVSIKNCVAAAPKAIMKNEQYDNVIIARIYPYDTGTPALSGNLAFSGMKLYHNSSQPITIPEADKNGNSRHGADVGLDSLRTLSTYTNMGWDFVSKWEWVTKNSKSYPALKLLPDQQKNDLFYRLEEGYDDPDVPVDPVDPIPVDPIPVDPIEPEPNIPVTSISLNKTSITLNAGAYITLTASYLPENTTGEKRVSWSTSNSAVASVNQDGFVRAHKAGSTTITATTTSGITAQCHITVLQPVTQIQAINPGVTLGRSGSKATLKAKVLPSDATNKALSWSSSSRKVKVSSSGVVTAQASSGKAVITAKAKDGSGKLVRFTVYIGIKVNSVKLNSSRVTLKPKRSVVLRATVSPAKAINKKVEWTSSKPKVAKVNSRGKVTAISKGKTVITAVSQDGSKKARCTVTVK